MLRGRVAIVTGAGGGLGRSHALTLARLGAKVLVNNMDPGAAELVEREIRESGGEAIGFAASVTDEPRIGEMVARAMAAWGRVDILVNNAGILRDRSFARMTMAEFREVTGRRLDELRAMGPDDFDRVGFTPEGEGPYRRFMEIRVFDCWEHEQDIRRAVGRPGHLEGPIAEAAVRKVAAAAGYVVGKKAGAPEGSSVVFDVHGPVALIQQVSARTGRGRDGTSTQLPPPFVERNRVPRAPATYSVFREPGSNSTATGSTMGSEATACQLAAPSVDRASPLSVRTSRFSGAPALISSASTAGLGSPAPAACQRWPASSLR